MSNYPYKTTKIPKLDGSLWSRGNFNSFIYVAEVEHFIWNEKYPTSRSKRKEALLTLVVGIVWPTHNYGSKEQQKLLFFKTIMLQTKFWYFIVHRNHHANAADFTKQNFLNNNGKFFKILFHYRSIKREVTELPEKEFYSIVRNSYGARNEVSHLSIDWE